MNSEKTLLQSREERKLELEKISKEYDQELEELKQKIGEREICE